MSGPPRTPARRDAVTETWFDGLVSGRLLLRVCAEGHTSRPDVHTCDVCGAFDLDWAESSGRGSVVARAVDHATTPPTCLVIVELVEGPWLITRVEDGAVDVGGEVVVRIAQPAEGEPYPVVRPRTEPRCAAIQI